MKSFLQYIIEAGQDVGKLELVSTDVKTARAYAEKQYKKYGNDLDTDIPNFDKNYLFAQKQAGSGRTQRKDMPVIDAKDVKDLQRRLKVGAIDVNTPRAKGAKGDPFPEGMNASTGKQWLKNGLKLYDGDAKDDKVNVSMQKVTVGKLHPIQKQIYFDKSIDALAEFGRDKSMAFMTSKGNVFIMSKDLYIIDGHHRFLSTVLLEPKTQVNALIIDLPIAKLLPLTLSYSDAVGNKRNA